MTHGEIGRERDVDEVLNAHRDVAFIVDRTLYCHGECGEPCERTRSSARDVRRAARRNERTSNRKVSDVSSDERPMDPVIGDGRVRAASDGEDGSHGTMNG